MVSTANELITQVNDTIATPDLLNGARTVILAGHYGSGKTSLAAALALRLRAEGNDTAICDLDVVNPYFRTSDRRAALEAQGVRVVASRYAGGNIDVPALPRELGAALAGERSYTILDVGGDDRGALALGRYAAEIIGSGDYAFLFVVNFFRPRTRTPEDAMVALREIELACGIRATALVNNSNLGDETTAQDLLRTVGSMERLSELSRLPLACTAAAKRLQPELEGCGLRPLWIETDQRFALRKAE